MINFQTQSWQIENVKAVFFDKDGTFIDLHYFWGKITQLRAQAIIKKFALKKECLYDLCYYLGYDLNTKKMLKDGITALYSRDKIIKIFKKDLERFNLFVSNKIIENIFDDVSTNFYKNMFDYVKPIDEAICFIKNLYQKHIEMAVITSDSVEVTKKTLEYFGWEKYFKVIIGRESTIYSKETGIPAKIALEKLNINPKDVVMIGDAPTDYLCAKKAGIEKTILVSTGQIDIEELKKTSQYVIDSLNFINLM